MSKGHHLKVVETDEHGQIVGTEVADLRCPECRTSLGACKSCRSKNDDLARKNDELAGLERVIRSQAATIQALLRDKADEARGHACWEVGGLLFAGWRRWCQHPKAQFSTERFWVAEPMLMGKRFGATLEDRCVLFATAIRGIAFDPYTKQRKNGKVARFDDWETMLKNESTYRRYADGAPVGWTPTLGEALLAAVTAAEERMMRPSGRRAS